MKLITHYDVIKYMTANYYMDFKRDGEKLVINGWALFGGYEKHTFPDNMVFNCGCDLEYSKITVLPSDIIINDNLYLRNTKIKEIGFSIRNILDMRQTDIVLKEGIYIGALVCLSHRNNYKIDCKSASRYWYLNNLKISGYFFNTGILS